MTDNRVAKACAVLGLAPNATFDDLDQRYLHLTSYWSSQRVNKSKEVAKRQQEEIDEAYRLLLPHFIKTLEDDPSLAKDEYTMKQVINGQDRIQYPSTNDDDLWVPPSRAKSPETDMDTDMENSSDSGDSGLGCSPRFNIQEVGCDILDAPDRAVIVHAVNCQGIWGYGVAAHLKRALPQAYNVYRSHCSQVEKPYDILGTCLLIPPQEEDYSPNVQKNQDDSKPARPVKSKGAISGKRLWVACLFTSVGYGKAFMAANNPGKDPPERILKNTGYALEDLRAQLEAQGLPDSDEQISEECPDDEKPGEIWSVKFNSGAFGVVWEETLQILESEFEGYVKRWFVVEKGSEGKARYKEDATDVEDVDADSSGVRGRSKIRLTLKRGCGNIQPPDDEEMSEAD